MPFVIGWILSVIAGPLVTFLEKKLKIMKRLGSAITIILVLALCIGLIYLIISQIWEEISVLIRNYSSALPNCSVSVQENVQKVYSPVLQSGSVHAPDHDTCLENCGSIPKFLPISGRRDLWIERVRRRRRIELPEAGIWV